MRQGSSERRRRRRRQRDETRRQRPARPWPSSSSTLSAAFFLPHHTHPPTRPQPLLALVSVSCFDSTRWFPVLAARLLVLRPNTSNFPCPAL
ncbi:hypothetical protein BDZ90DRAFT_28403 [Jaminaea rosea]|uniref:Uncharacterized protein n=1 Tax=Jaminaea rosea TaxID=1569628 RepID=A0A316V3Z6_9BASI|nr:hypothetical protein BDZ90DRAFT_28403 [Jaminaea rosea]PWN30933.1 hypothetical protein BDZ90DRAFT_28403 [Jaminaea rosea]